MLECRTYTYDELSKLFQTPDNQGIKRKLDRMDVAYTATGRGQGLKVAITEIRNPFKVYCHLDLGFPANTNFKKLAYFIYYLLNDDEFQQLPSARMEACLRADGHTLSRQTISNYLSCLEGANLICRGFGYRYYFAFGKYHRDTDEITYKRAWAEHWGGNHRLGAENYGSGFGQIRLICPFRFSYKKKEKDRCWKTSYPNIIPRCI